jgi:PAS domain-containing protein
MLLSSRAKLNAGKPSGITGVLSDITEHKLAVEALGKSEAYFRALTENASDLIMVLTPDGRPSYISPAFERITGYALGAE